MSKLYSKENGYYKHYNKEGISYRVKFDKAEKLNVEFEEYVSIILKFKDESTHDWMYHVPKHKFTSIFSVIRYIGKNLITKCKVFEVSISKTIKI